MSQITTHVLDAAAGAPAVGVAVVLEQRRQDGWHAIATGATDGDGRVSGLGPETLAPGAYRLVFATGDWFGAAGRATFYPEVLVAFVVQDASHHHVPLLLSPFAYSTYRGS